MNRRLAWSLAGFITAWTRLFAQQADRVALPIAPIDAVVNAFESHSIVAIGEPHGNEQFHAFRLALLRNPRFQSAVDDIVVESGTRAISRRWIVSSLAKRFPASRCEKCGRTPRYRNPCGTCLFRKNSFAPSAR